MPANRNAQQNPQLTEHWQHCEFDTHTKHSYHNTDKGHIRLKRFRSKRIVNSWRLILTVDGSVVQVQVQGAGCRCHKWRTNGQRCATSACPSGGCGRSPWWRGSSRARRGAPGGPGPIGRSLGSSIRLSSPIAPWSMSRSLRASCASSARTERISSLSLPIRLLSKWVCFRCLLFCLLCVALIFSDSISILKQCQYSSVIFALYGVVAIFWRSATFLNMLRSISYLYKFTN